MTDTPVISTDLYPTILDVAGLPRLPHQHVDGVSLAGEFDGRPLEREAIYWHYPHYNQHPQSFPAGVVRAELEIDRGLRDGRTFFFNLSTDIGESSDMASQNPQKVAELYRLLELWRADVGADPMTANPEYEPKMSDDTR